MSIQILRRQPLKFYTNNGISFFEPFNAVDSQKNPLRVSWNHKQNSSLIIAKNEHNDIGVYDMELNSSQKIYKGLSLVANPKHKGIGEVLNLASLINFKENNFNNYTVFSLRDSIQFYAKYGFNLLSFNITDIMHNLSFLTKNKSEKFIDIKNSAKFFMEQIGNKDIKEKNEFITQGNNLVSDYIRKLARDGQKIDGDDLYNHAHMHFSTIDAIKNKDYLNELLDKHEINYTI